MIEKMYNDSLLAAASYAKWDGSISNIDTVLSSKGFTAEQIIEFKRVYTVNGTVEYFDDSFLNGFAAVVFTNINTGKKKINEKINGVRLD